MAGKNTSLYGDAVKLLTGIKPIAVMENQNTISFIDASWNYYDIKVIKKRKSSNDTFEEYITTESLDQKSKTN